MRVLQVVKTSDGARWAAWQTRVLTDLGIKVDVLLPHAQGEAVALWEQSGAQVHVADVSLPLRHPQRWTAVRQKIRRLVDQIAPDLIHCHFVTNMLALRLALGREHPIPRIFQVPGPLHLESPLTRWLDLKTFGGGDYWIASSRYTSELYRKFRAPHERVFLSYYGSPLDLVSARRGGALRTQLGISAAEKVVGNISYIYPPKYFLGHTAGLKGQEYVIDALARVSKKRSDVTGVLVGGQWSGGSAYRERLIERARREAGCRIRFADRVGLTAVNTLWADFDCVVHLPVSENCGGVIEPLAAEVPTVASRVGGLPEIIADGVTGWSVPPRNAEAAADAILEALDNPAEAQRRTQSGKQLVLEMFNPQRTGREVAQIYQHILDKKIPAPSDFDSARFMREGAS